MLRLAHFYKTNSLRVLQRQRQRQREQRNDFLILVTPKFQSQFV